MKKLSFNQWASYGLSAFTFVATEIAALVPSWGPATTHVIQGGGSVMAAATLIAGGIHHLASIPVDKAAVMAVAESAEDKLRAQVAAAGMKPAA